jgi:hypothetical protein
LGKNLTAAQRLEIAKKRQRLANRLFTHEQTAEGVMALDRDVVWDDQPVTIDAGLDDQPEGEEDEPENVRLALPSYLGINNELDPPRTEIQRLQLEKLARQEAQLRLGYINDALEGLRLSLGEKSFRLKTDVRHSQGQRQTGRAWGKVHNLDKQARSHRHAYRQHYAALQKLNLFTEELGELQDITDQDMKVPGDLTEEARYNQSRDKLPWFWVLRTEDSGEPAETLGDDRLRDSEFAIPKEEFY